MNDQTQSTFDADAFMQQTVDGPLETEYKLVPVGEYQNAYIEDFDSKALQLSEGDSAKTGKAYSFLKFSLPFKITDDPKIMNEIGMDTARVYKELNLDRTDSGGIATGPNKNVELGRIYEAAGLNSGNAALSNLRGTGPFVITVVHESGKRKDGSEWKQARVGKITRQS
jgi:hypothetical protein